MTLCTICHEPIYRSTPETTPGRDTPTGWRHVAGDEAKGMCHWARAEEEKEFVTHRAVDSIAAIASRRLRWLKWFVLFAGR